jgi:hypothetical protein
MTRIKNCFGSFLLLTALPLGALAQPAGESPSAVGANQTSRPVSNASNPAIGLILNGRFSRFKQEPDTYALPGFALAEETGPGEEGFNLGESELVMSANIDNLFRGHLTAALTPDNEVEIEEAYLDTLGLGGGFNVRAGRFLSGIGYLNSIHAHAWDFADAPLVYRALFGNSYGDDGVQLRWVAPTDLLVEVGTEMFRGDAFPGGGSAKDGKGTRAAFVRFGGDVGPSHAWRVGLSHLKTEAVDRATGDETAPDIFNGTSKTSGIDFVWKWAPNGNARTTNLKLQAEYFTRDEDGEFDPAGTGAVDYAGKQTGWYAQAVYQFMPRWRIGARVDGLKADDVEVALAGSVLDNQGHNPRRHTLMLDFSNSEFSRLRLQWNRDESRADVKDTQVYLQYVVSLGAHAAHTF